MRCLPPPEECNKKRGLVGDAGAPLLREDLQRLRPLRRGINYRPHNRPGRNRERRPTSEAGLNLHSGAKGNISSAVAFPEGGGRSSGFPPRLQFTHGGGGGLEV